MSCLQENLTIDGDISRNIHVAGVYNYKPALEMEQNSKNGIEFLFAACYNMVSRNKQKLEKEDIWTRKYRKSWLKARI